MTTRRAFTVAALTLGAAAPLAGSPFRTRPCTVDVDELARVIESGEDHIEALDLGEMIMARKGKLRVIDLRSGDAFADAHIPTAESVPITGVAELRVAAGDLVVFYSEGGAHAAQAWMILRALGHQRTVFLRSGFDEWTDLVMFPSLPVAPTEVEQREFERASALAKYFGGEARTGVSRSQHAASVDDRRRRGC